MDPVLKNTKKELLLGNEAIVRGALEVGLSFATTYPGTPASEVGNVLAKIAKKLGIYFEFSTNEKVALETAAGAAFSGLPAMVSLKHYGLNVALDSLLPLIYLECPLVVVVADDPGSWSSIQTEQDSRWISRLGHLPTLEPSDSQEAKEMTKYAFKLTKKYKIPVLIRLTTRVCHTRSLVKYGKIFPTKRKGNFYKTKNLSAAGSLPTIERHKNLLSKIKEIEKSELLKTKLNKIFKDNSNKVGIIASGVSYYYAKEAINEIGINLPILKIGFSYPFPKDITKKFIKNLEKVLIVEETDAIIEYEIRQIAKNVNPKLKIYGKDLLPQIGEMRPEYVLVALSKILNKSLPKNLVNNQKYFKLQKIEKRLPNLCPGCPHRATFWIVKKALGKNKIFAGDIGCYLLGALPPYKMADYIVAMGASVGLSHGVSKSTGKKPVIFIGDSTFFHAGIPALINTVFNKSDVLIIILDNRITAMTGHQPHPGTGITGLGEKTKALKIEEVVQSCGVDSVEVINVYNINESIVKVKKAYQKKGISVVVAKGECRLLTVRKLARIGVRTPKFEIFRQSPNLEILKDFGCPAIRKHKGKYYIDENVCWGCGVCRQIFPKNIRLKK